MKLKYISRWIFPFLNKYKEILILDTTLTLWKIVRKYQFYITKLLLQRNMTNSIQISFLWYSHDLQLPQMALPTQPKLLSIPFSVESVFPENHKIYFIFKNLIILANYLYNLLLKWCLVVSKNSVYHRCWERLKAGERDDREWDGWMASPTQWTWVWASSGS